MRAGFLGEGQALLLGARVEQAASEQMHGKRANLQLWPKAARGLTHQPKTANPATPQAGARQQHCTTLVQVQQ